MKGSAIVYALFDLTPDEIALLASPVGQCLYHGDKAGAKRRSADAGRKEIPQGASPSVRIRSEHTSQWAALG